MDGRPKQGKTVHGPIWSILAIDFIAVSTIAPFYKAPHLSKKTWGRKRRRAQEDSEFQEEVDNAFADFECYLKGVDQKFVANNMVHVIYKILQRNDSLREDIQRHAERLRNQPTKVGNFYLKGAPCPGQCLGKCGREECMQKCIYNIGQKTDDEPNGHYCDDAYSTCFCVHPSAAENVGDHISNMRDSLTITDDPRTQIDQYFKPQVGQQPQDGNFTAARMEEVQRREDGNMPDYGVCGMCCTQLTRTSLGPVEQLCELELSMDPATAEVVRELHSAKVAAVSREDYVEAKRLKEHIDRLRHVGVRVAQLEARKRHAEAREDYDTCKELKAEIDGQDFLTGLR